MAETSVASEVRSTMGPPFHISLASPLKSDAFSHYHMRIVVPGVQVWNFFLSVIQGSITSHSMVSCGESVIKILATDHNIDRSYT